MQFSSPSRLHLSLATHICKLELNVLYIIHTLKGNAYVHTNLSCSLSSLSLSLSLQIVLENAAKHEMALQLRCALHETVAGPSTWIAVRRGLEDIGTTSERSWHKCPSSAAYFSTVPCVRCLENISFSAVIRTNQKHGNNDSLPFRLILSALLIPLPDNYCPLHKKSQPLLLYLCKKDLKNTQSCWRRHKSLDSVSADIPR